MVIKAQDILTALQFVTELFAEWSALEKAKAEAKQAPTPVEPANPNG